MWFFNETANKVLKILGLLSFGLLSKGEVSEVRTPDEIAVIIDEARQGGTIRKQAGQDPGPHGVTIAAAVTSKAEGMVQLLAGQVL